MKFKKCLLPVAMLASFTLAGCQSNADDHAADVYQTDQLNTKQETKTVNIISILPAKVAVDNSQNKRKHKPSARLLAQSLAVLSATTSVLAAIPERRQGQLAAEL
ncbi:putative outer membrane lipoprotein [Escherichia coli 3-267-03_S4_C2]|nr:putative outer membrane lipoprotein [Escherichia coli 3-267-03_S4_C2]KEL85811.1 putative outer membrane lipoprotein [Escherichia coli 5-366-08_S3_C2]